MYRLLINRRDCSQAMGGLTHAATAPATASSAPQSGVFSPNEVGACTNAPDATECIARNFHNDRERLMKISIQCYGLRKDGAYAAASVWNGGRRAAQFSVNDGGKTRLEPYVFLLQR